VAVQMEVHSDTICHWESGCSRPKVSFIPRIYDFLGYCPWQAATRFGEWLGMVRRSLGLSRKQLGRRYHIDESTLWRLESGRSKPTRQTEERLRDLLLSIVSGAPIVRRLSRTQLSPGRRQGRPPRESLDRVRAFVGE
jgi:DNA-binding transcriptional regulator YiaG